MNYNIEIENVPDGWEPVAFRVAKAGDNYWDEVEHIVRQAKVDMDYRYVIMEKKRWRAKENELYWFIRWADDVGSYGVAETCDDIDERNWGDDAIYDSGNYFQTQEQAQAVADKINQLLQDAHK